MRDPMAFLAALVLCGPACAASSSKDDARPTTGYATVDGLPIYYESHGSGRPLVLLHGGLTTLDLSFGEILPTLAASRRVIAIEQQGHGRTADRDAPLSFATMAADTAAVLRELDIVDADVLGLSDGGVVALELAVRYPERVGKLVLVEAGFSNASLDPATLAWLAQARPEDFAPLDAHYARVAPDPAHWATLVEKWKRLQLEFDGIPPDALRSVQVPTLILAGDRGVRAEHTVELFRHLPAAELAVLPAADHFLLSSHSAQALPLITAFLDKAPKS